MDLTCVHHEQRPAKARCVECGQHLCGECRVKVAGRYRCRPCVPESLHRKLPGRRSPTFASVLSVVPGLGQMYAGRFGRGLAFLLSAGILAANAHAVPQPLPLFLWVFNLFDAMSVAHERNARKAGIPLDPSVSVQRRFWGLFGTGLAVFAVARSTVAPALDPDLLWPGALGLYGLFLLFDRKAPHVRTA
ncbi:MAG: B-box zinc finger protein [Planctomycetota bacterium JB042]